MNDYWVFDMCQACARDSTYVLSPHNSCAEAVITFYKEEMEGAKGGSGGIWGAPMCQHPSV